MAIAGVVLMVLYNIDGDVPWRVYVALEGMRTVALFCGLTLLFLAIVFVANDRYECAEDAYDGYSGGKKHPLRWWSFVWSFVIFGLGVSAGGLWVWQLMSATSSTRYDYFQIIVYTAGAVFTISGILAIAQATVSYKRMNRAGVTDRVCLQQ
jgi:Ni/Fe-hydrogenase subunit HybB-like protein